VILPGNVTEPGIIVYVWQTYLGVIRLYRMTWEICPHPRV